MKKEIEKPLSYEYAIKNAFAKKENKKFKNSFWKIAATTLGIMLCCTVVMATSYILYESVWKEPKEYNSYEDKVTSEKKNEEISKEETEDILSNDYILDKANKIFKILNYDNSNLFIDLKRSYSAISDLYYEVKTSKDYFSGIELNFNAEDGSLIYFIDRDIDSNYNVKIDKISSEEATNIGNEIYLNLEITDNYKLKSVDKISKNMNSSTREEWYLKYYMDYDNILNKYQRLEIRFYLINNEIKISQIAIYDDGYNYENNEVKTSKDDALKIAEEEDRIISNLDIRTIDVNLDIKPMNGFVYLQEKSLGKDDGIVEEISQDGNTVIYNKYSSEKRLRKVWTVKIVYEFNYTVDDPVNNWQEQFGRDYYIDATTGEIIGGNWGESLPEGGNWGENSPSY